jgi:hypothetical protein
MARKTFEQLLAERTKLWESMAGRNRWGDTRRWQGRNAGVCMDKLRKLDARINKMIEDDKKQRGKTGTWEKRKTTCAKKKSVRRK